MRPHILWSAIEAGGSALFSVLGSFVIAHLIGPAELTVQGDFFFEKLG